MIGDSGTILPSYFTEENRPKHWERIPGILNGQVIEEENDVRVQQLANSSPIEVGVKDGKFTAGDNPLRGSPKNADPKDKSALCQAQSEQVDLLIEIGDALDRPNFNWVAFRRLLLFYRTRLKSAAPHWFAVDQAMNTLRAQIEEEGGYDGFNSEVRHPLQILVQLHPNLREVIEPKEAADRPLSPSIDETQSPDDLQATSRDLAIDLLKIIGSQEARAQMDHDFRMLAITTIRDLKESQPPSYPTENEKRRALARVKRALTSAAQFLGQFVLQATAALAGNLGAAALLNPEAAKMLLTQAQRLFQPLLNLFSS